MSLTLLKALTVPGLELKFQLPIELQGGLHQLIGPGTDRKSRAGGVDASTPLGSSRCLGGPKENSEERPVRLTLTPSPMLL